MAMVKVMNATPTDLDPKHSQTLSTFFRFFGKLVKASEYRLLLTRIAYEELEWSLYVQQESVEATAEKYGVAVEAVRLFKQVYESQRDSDGCQTIA